MAIEAGVPFNLHSFRNTIGDPARPYLFLVHIPEIGTDTVVTAMAKSTSLPGYTLGETSISFQGAKMKLGEYPTFQDWTVSFICDEAHELRRLFLRWQSLVYDIGTQTVGHSHSYKSDQLGCAQLARDGQQTAIYGFIGAFPKTVADIAVGHETSGVESFDVGFAYDYYVRPAALGDNHTGAVPFVRDTAKQVPRGPGPGNANFNPMQFQ